MGDPKFDRKSHWEGVYRTKQAQETSWYQKEPLLSLAMIANAGIDLDAPIIDVGGGASVLVDRLLDLAYRDLTVLDISQAALQQDRQRLGRRASRVDWIVADITEYTPGRTFDLWHDRATFHFLTDSDDQEKYVRRLNEALDPGGQVIIAAFALDGPRQCSGLDIVRYDGASLGEALGPDFRLEEQVLETHITPLGREQRFDFYRFRRTG